MFHPKVIHSDHSSIQFLHRRDPNVGILNGGFSQPLVNLKPKPELRITEDEYNRWREDQFQKALDERRRLQDAQEEAELENDNGEDEEDYTDDKNETKDDNNEDLLKKHKANKANSTLGRKEIAKHKNHNYHQDYEATNYEKTYANHPSRQADKKKQRSPLSVRQPAEQPRKKPQRYGFVGKPEIVAAHSDNKPQYYNYQAASDPTFYSTIPRDQSVAASDHQDDIYSGLLSNRYDKKIVVKSKLLADINFNRKKQTKAIAASLARRSQ